jgi:hypothetical protein
MGHRILAGVFAPVARMGGYAPGQSVPDTKKPAIGGSCLVQFGDLRLDLEQGGLQR